MKLAAVVLAAGRSSRMGLNKLLLSVGGRKVLEHIVKQLEPIPTFVVTGNEADEVAQLAQLNGAQTVYNPDYLKGMTSSFQAGLSILDNDVDAVFMVLGDTFGFKHELLDRMIKALKKNSEALIVSPMYKGRRGHPVLFRRVLFNDFKNLKPGETLKTVIDHHEDHHIYVEGNVWTVTDLDTLEDYEKVRRLWSANCV